MANHAKLSASSAIKWLNCTASIRMEENIPKEESTFAKEGTTAHTLAELKLRCAIGSISKEEYDREIEKLEIDEEMEKHTECYKNFVLEKYRKNLTYSNDVLIAIEKCVDYSRFARKGFGTADALLICDRHIDVIDLKYGKGVEVSAENNPQIMLYALGALEEYDWLYDIKNVTMAIYQPRKNNISTFEMTAKELYQWGESIQNIAEEAYNGNGECVPGAHCTEGFCRAIPICRAFAESMCEVSKYQGKKLSELSHYEIAHIIEKAESLAKWAKGIKEYALQQALQGVEFKGYKVVEGRKTRAYSIPDDDVAKILFKKGYTEDIVYKKSLRTVADMEKQLKDKFHDVLGEFVAVHRNPTLVPLDDKRPLYGSAENDFKYVDTI
ncbi:DUF2800 domain-containing protein [Lachnospiraceae bacterium 46-61]